MNISIENLHVVSILDEKQVKDSSLLTKTTKLYRIVFSDIVENFKGVVTNQVVLGVVKN